MEYTGASQGIFQQMMNNKIFDFDSSVSNHILQCHRVMCQDGGILITCARRGRQNMPASNLSPESNLTFTLSPDITVICLVN